MRICWDKKESVHLSRATASPQYGVGVPVVAQTKVGNDSLTVGLVQQDVLHLDVAVDDALQELVACFSFIPTLFSFSSSLQNLLKSSSGVLLRLLPIDQQWPLLLLLGSQKHRLHLGQYSTGIIIAHEEFTNSCPWRRRHSCAPEQGGGKLAFAADDSKFQLTFRFSIVVELQDQPSRSEETKWAWR